jgi:hypothetical protein
VCQKQESGTLHILCISCIQATVLQLRVIEVVCTCLPQAVSRWHRLADGSVRFQASPRGICCGRSGTVRGFLEVLLVFSFNIITPLLHIRVSFVYYRQYITLVIVSNFKYDNSVCVCVSCGMRHCRGVR